MKLILITAFVVFSVEASAQSYTDSMQAYQQDYVAKHEVVKGHDKTHMQFYAADKAFRVEARLTPSKATEWITFKTSGTKDQLFRLYGTVAFSINGKPQRLNLYQSQQTMGITGYENYLFLPFTDSTSGDETYSSGRYIDLKTEDIKEGKLLLDFNKAYNPYCAYVTGVYNCPIPPKENALPVAIHAGEKTFSKAH